MKWPSQESSDLYQTCQTDACHNGDYGQAAKTQIANEIRQSRHKQLVDEFRGVY